MKTNLLKYILLTLGLQFMAGCSPDDYTYHDNSRVDINTIGKVVLKPDHTLLIADGNARLDLRPFVYTKEGYLIPDARIDPEWLEYAAPEGMSLSRYFSTSDASLIGRTVNTRVKIKGTEISSETVRFQIVAPLEAKYNTDIRIPVIFHVVQTKEEVEKFGGIYTYDRIQLMMDKLNNVFGGIVSTNPVGVDTHIRFVFAAYDPYGKRMLSPGVNYLTVGKIRNGEDEEEEYDDREEGEGNEETGEYDKFIRDNHLDWPADRYLNIWLLSDQGNDIEDFGGEISEHCSPHYVKAGVPEEEIPEGLELNEYTGDTEFQINELGIIYKLQELDVMNRGFGDDEPVVNELIYYIGHYLGLLPTYAVGGYPEPDYCGDTHKYAPVSGTVGNNKTWYKEADGCYFRAENIMDDPTGVHCSISKNQCERMRWVLENCPDRAAWKSDFAFTGKE